MEIRSIGLTDHNASKLPKRTASLGEQIVDSFSYSKPVESNDLSELSRRLLFGKLESGKKGIKRMGSLPSGEGIVLSKLKLDLGTADKRVVSNIVTTSEDSLFVVTERKNAENKYDYYLAETDILGDFRQEQVLFTLDEPVGKFELKASDNGFACVAPGKSLYLANKGYPVKLFPLKSFVYHRLVQSNDGMTYLLDKVDDIGPNGVLTTIRPDGEIAWKKNNPIGEIVGDSSGNLYFHTKYKTILKFNSNGETEDLSFLVDSEHPCRDLFPMNGGIAVVKGSPRAGVHDCFTFFDGKSESVNWKSGGMIKNIKFDDKNKKFLALVGEWRQMRLCSINMDGNMEWSVELPESHMSPHNYMIDGDGHIVMLINGMGERTNIPNSFRDKVSKFIGGKDKLKDATGMILYFSKDGSLIWADKEIEPFYEKNIVKRLSDGSILIDAGNGNYEILAIGKTLKDVVNKSIEEQKTEKKAAPEIIINEKAGEVNIGGVKLPIKKVRKER